MARINLLPWRDELRKQKQKDFGKGIFMSVLVTGAILFLVHMHIESLKEYQTQRNKILQDEITILDGKIKEIKDIEDKKSQLLKKIDVIHTLQESRPQIVHLFDEIPRVTPDGVFLNKVTQEVNKLTFVGKAESNARVSSYMRAIENSAWLDIPKLEIIQGTGDAKSGKLNDFTLYATQGKLKPEEDNTGAKKGAKQ